ncbi:restriction endonuclease [bacterium]|nr:MAG: restriction endonuclease [bacterium]
MNLILDAKKADGYKSQSQKVRVMSEHWAHSQAYCPNCGRADFDKYENNKEVADFFCSNCKEDFELKSSKNKKIAGKIRDGAYKTMIERLESNNNPNLFLMNYNSVSLNVLNFLVVPKHFFVPAIIKEENPLSPTARRAGHVLCSILLDDILQTGKIYFIRNGVVEQKEKVMSEWKKTLFLSEEKEVSVKGWMLDVMKCVEDFGQKEFTLNDVYAFEDEFKSRHPDNKHIKDKIRQQLQVLRNKGYLEFISRGYYRRAHS